jgi:hypothetical protein
VTQVANDYPDSIIAVVLGARHIPCLKESLEAEHGYREISICWFDVLEVCARGKVFCE